MNPLMISFYLFTFGSYLIGAIPTGYWLGKIWKGIDIRQHGSGNLGATNVFRVLGKGPGSITLAFDILKGALPVIWAQHLYPNFPNLAIAAGIAAILGHTTSPFVGFRGGKGVATSAGVFGALLPIPTVISLSAFLVTLWFSRMISASSIVAVFALTISAFVLTHGSPIAYVAAGIGCLVIWTHRANIQRIFAGTESRIGSKRAA